MSKDWWSALSERWTRRAKDNEAEGYIKKTKANLVEGWIRTAKADSDSESEGAPSEVRSPSPLTADEVLQAVFPRPPQPVEEEDPRFPFFPCYEPQVVKQASRKVRRSVRELITMMLIGRQQRKYFSGEVIPITPHQYPLRDLPVMERKVFDAWWNGQPQEAFVTYLRTHEMSLTTQLMSTEEIIRAEKERDNAIDLQRMAWERVHSLRRTLMNERIIWRGERRRLMKEVEDAKNERDEEMVKRMEMEEQLEEMKGIEEKLMRCEEKLADIEMRRGEEEASTSGISRMPSTSGMKRGSEYSPEGSSSKSARKE